MTRLGKIRPVGNRVPAPDETRELVLPWQDRYQTRFFDSGTSALSIAIGIARDTKPDIRKPEVLLPGYGCPDLIAAAHAQGVTPVLVDLSPDSPWMELTDLRNRITENTVAIVAVNFLGLAAPLESIADLARASGALLIEDSAQRMPPSSTQNGKADLAVLSFGRGKPVNLMGGGALLIGNALQNQASRSSCRSDVLAQRATIRWAIKRQIFNLLVSRVCYGLLERIPVLRLGETRFHALERITPVEPIPGLLAAGLSRFEQAPDYRRELSKRLEPLDASGWVRLPEACGRSEERNERLLRYSLLAPDTAARDHAVSVLNHAGIAANTFYGAALPNIPGVASYLKGSEVLPQAEAFASRLVTLPVHEDVTPSDIRLMTDTLLKSAQQ